MWTKREMLMALMCCAAGSALQPSRLSQASRLSQLLRLSQSSSCPDAELADGQSKCSSCSEVSFCIKGRVNSVSCGPDQACSQDVGSAFCLPVERTPCNTCDEGTHTACDPYNDAIVHSCPRGQAPAMLCPETQTCFKGTCVDRSKSSSPDLKIVSEVCDEDIDGDHFVVIPPECTIGVLCSRNESGAIVYECDEGYYFEVQTVSCEPLPIDNCARVYQGFAPDRTNCSNGVVCEDGRQVSSFSCGYFHLYDIDTNTCVEVSEANCSELDGCDNEGAKTNEFTF